MDILQCKECKATDEIQEVEGFCNNCGSDKITAIEPFSGTSFELAISNDCKAMYEISKIITKDLISKKYPYCGFIAAEGQYKAWNEDKFSVVNTRYINNKLTSISCNLGKITIDIQGYDFYLEGMQLNIKNKINWSSFGSQDLETTLNYAERLKNACEISKKIENYYDKRNWLYKGVN